MAGFEPATTCPPDMYANQAALHPAYNISKIYFTKERTQGLALN